MIDCWWWLGGETFDASINVSLFGFFFILVVPLYSTNGFDSDGLFFVFRLTFVSISSRLLFIKIDSKENFLIQRCYANSVIQKKKELNLFSLHNSSVFIYASNSLVRCSKKWSGYVVHWTLVVDFELRLTWMPNRLFLMTMTNKTNDVNERSFRTNDFIEN